MVEIIPAILTSNFEELESMVRVAETFAHVLHIDVTDGQFVPSISTTVVDIRTVAPRIPFEIHLMVEHPDDFLLDALASNPCRILVHQTSKVNHADLCSTIAKHHCEAALAVNPSASLDELELLLPSISQLTFLAVDPGFQGNAMIPGVLQQARMFHADHPNIVMEIDGGIKLTNVPQIAATGAERFVVGSGILQTQDPAASYQQFCSAFHQHMPNMRT